MAMEPPHPSQRVGFFYRRITVTFIPFLSPLSW
jgi:hypothetical protein